MTCVSEFMKAILSDSYKDYSLNVTIQNSDVSLLYLKDVITSLETSLQRNIMFSKIDNNRNILQI